MDVQAAEIEFIGPAAILAARKSSVHDNDKAISRKKMQSIVSRGKKKKDPNFNPLLSSSAEAVPDESDNDDDTPAVIERVHAFSLTTVAAKTDETSYTRCVYNMYCMFACSNAVLLVGVVLLIQYFGVDYMLESMAILVLVAGVSLNAFTLWKFCGERLFPYCFRHQNDLIFDDDEKRIFIRWNGLIKATSISYSEFARLYLEETSAGKYANVYVATNASHYRFNKFLCATEDAKTFVAKVNDWYNIDRVEQKHQRYDNRIILMKQHAAHKQKQLQMQKEEQDRAPTEHEIYLQNEEELTKLIKTLKYKSFSEQDIANGSQLKHFFDSKYRAKMVEEYHNLKAELDNKRNAGDDGDALILNNARKYIVSALLLKFETVDQIIEERRKSKVEFMMKDIKQMTENISCDDGDDDDDNY